MCRNPEDHSSYSFFEIMTDRQRQKPPPRALTSKPDFLLKILPLVMLMILHVACASESDDGASKLDFNELKTRLARQFKDFRQSDIGLGEGSVAMSLVEALQKWADNLEAQISMMRTEVMTLKVSNREVKETVSELAAENSKLKEEIGRLSVDWSETKGSIESIKDQMTDFDLLKNDFMIVSTSFSEFVGDYTNFTQVCVANFTSLSNEITALNTIKTQLSSTLTDSTLSLKNVTSFVNSVSDNVKMMETEIGQYKNFSLTKFDTMDRDMEKIQNVFVNKTTIEHLMSHVAQEIIDMNDNIGKNMSIITNEINFLSGGIKNKNADIQMEVDELKVTTKKLSSESQSLLQMDEKFSSDLVALSASLEYFMSTNEDRWKGNDLKLLKFDARGSDLTGAVENIQSRLNGFEDYLPSLMLMNSSTIESFGHLRLNVSRLDEITKALKSDLKQMESIVIVLDMNASVASNTTTVLGDKLSRMERNVTQLKTRTDDLFTGLVKLIEVQREASDNSTKLQNDFHFVNKTISSGLRVIEKNHTNIMAVYQSLEKHFVDLKRDVYESQMDYITLNSTIHSPEGLRQDLLSVGQAIANTTYFITQRIDKLDTFVNTFQSQIYGAKNSTEILSGKFEHFLSVNFTTMEQIHLSGLKTMKAELGKHSLGLSGLMNFSLEIDTSIKSLQENVTSYSTFLSGLQLNGTDLAKKVVKLYELNAFLTQRVVETANHLKGNSSKLSVSQTVLEGEFSQLSNTYNSLQLNMNEQSKVMTDMEASVQKINQESLKTRTDVDALKFEVTNMNAELSGITGFVTSVQGHISLLKSNMTMIIRNVTLNSEEISDTRAYIDQIGGSMTLLHTNLSQTMTMMSETEQKLEVMENNVTTIKTNLVGLGAYINSVNGDVNQLMVSLDSFANKVAVDVLNMKNNVTDLSTYITDTKISNMEVKKQMDAIDFITTTIRNDLAGLTSKIYNIKTSLFEQTNELSAMKINQENLQLSMEKNENKLIEVYGDKTSGSKNMEEVKSDMIALRTGLASLTNTVFTLKSQFDLNNVQESALRDLRANVSLFRQELTYHTREMSVFKPELQLLKSDFHDIRNSMSQMGRINDPDRFSCSVSSEEIRNPGVITYSACTVNSDDLLNKNTGHFIARRNGDYFVSFTANLVSVNSQAIWCALYKQGSGKEGWEVLGMINNFQRNAGLEDDRDSASMSLIVPMETGDEVWIEWRGYGESFLYSNPYKLITFTGFMITGPD